MEVKKLNSKGYEENLYTKGCMRTFTGIYVPIEAPETKHFCIEDIAHALSMTPRFAGHFPVWWSVADHSLYCAKLAMRFGADAYQCLMHDCSEAYLNDIVSPVKSTLRDYKVIEDLFMRVLNDKFKFGYPLSQHTHEIDRRALELEWEVMIGNQHIVSKTPSQSRDEFIEAYESLNILP